MATQVKNKKGFLIIKMSWREYVAATDTFGFCSCCGTQSFPEDGYYVAMVNDWYCKTCYDAYISGATHFKVDLEKERLAFNDMKNKLIGLGTWENV